MKRDHDQFMTVLVSAQGATGVEGTGVEGGVGVLTVGNKERTNRVHYLCYCRKRCFGNKTRQEDLYHDTKL